MIVSPKFDNLIDRLNNKVSMSKTPVPGFIMGLSGTDSIVTFILLYETMRLRGELSAQRVRGDHYVEGINPGWFQTKVIPWLRKRCPDANINVRYTLTGINDDESRWATLTREANNGNYWIASAVNCTEKNLGTYSIVNKSASIWPIGNVWKTDVMEHCKMLSVPKVAMDMARLPDCLCGRDELAAENLELIDEILQYRVDPTKYDPELLKKMIEYVKDTKDLYGFKDRTPYLV
jgi:NH3-dependent NAD+ synthetase